MLKHSLRGCADWNECGLPIKSTTSDEATKLYDCALNQFCGLYDDQNYGGMIKTFSDMSKADPNFLLGETLILALELGGSKPDDDSEIMKRVNHLFQLVEKNRDSYEEREVKHVDALKYLVKGDVKGTTRVWQQILSEYPTDIHAIRLTHGFSFEFGLQQQMRDSIAQVVSHWTGKGLPYEGYVHGMYAFGLEETNLFSKAESESNLALEMNPMDGWATHAMAHIHETKGLSKIGIEFLEETEQNWTKSNMMACHNYWHLALHNIEEGQYERALNIFDDKIITRAQTRGRIGNIVDATSLLFRLDLTEPNLDLVTDQRWQQVYGVAKPFVPNSHDLGFIDTHLLMACLGAKHMDSVEQIVEKVNGYESNEEWLKTTRVIVNALVEYKRENYGKCVDLLFGVRYETQCMGGSNAQRDVFNRVLISAALKSSKEWHKKLAINLMNESNSFR